ncbi:MAG TPA: zinc ribbon domain-containing protein, partial [Ktedonobacteraceae bacterium]
MTVRCSLGHENPDGSAFCDECGEPLSGAAPEAAQPAASSQPAPPQPEPAAAPAGTQTCSSCGASNPAGEAFCSNCGVSLLGAPAQAPQGASAEDVSASPTVAASASQPAPVSAPVATQAARLIVEADNQEFDLSGKDNITIGREDAVSNIYPDVDLTPHGGEEGGVS